MSTGADTLPQKHALIMKGGGSKGLAYIGAIEVLEKTYTFDWFIGTSAGAITAVLLGAGYSVQELKEILYAKDFNDFFDSAWYAKLPNLLLHKGFHSGDAFTLWLDDLLTAKLNLAQRVKISDLPYQVTIYASSTGDANLKFDRDNDAYASYAARCSMSIPYIFFPQSHQGMLTVDGGIKNNYPLNQFLAENSGRDFIGLYLGTGLYKHNANPTVIGSLSQILLESEDAKMIDDYRDRTVIIDPRPVQTLDFDLDQNDKELLLVAGKFGAEKHLRGELSASRRYSAELNTLRNNSIAKRLGIKRKKKIKWTITIITAIILVAVGIWGYYAYAEYKRIQYITLFTSPLLEEELPSPINKRGFPSKKEIMDIDTPLENTSVIVNNNTNRNIHVLWYDISMHHKSRIEDWNPSFFTGDWAIWGYTKETESKWPEGSNWFALFVFDFDAKRSYFMGFYNLTTKKQWILNISWSGTSFEIKDN